MKNKGLIITAFVVLIVVFSTAGLIGLLESKKGKEEPPINNYTVTYEYFLDGEKVEELPTNLKNQTNYAYSTYSCSNKVEGEWINNEWKFSPDLTANSTCKLYFVSTEFQMSFKIENGSINGLSADENGIVLSNKKGATGTDFIQEIIPTEGYSYKDASCDSDSELSWDKENNELTIKNVKQHTVCNVTFEISSYEIKTVVENGTGASSLTIKHEEDANVTISPSVGYGNPSVSCTNKQNGTWANNKLTISKLTDNTICTIKFNILKYDITLSATNGTVNPSGKQSVDHNSSKTFIATPNEGYTTTGYTITGCESATKTADTTKVTITINSVIKNQTCSISFLEAPELPSTTE